jgi:homoserine acetyltransferase
MKLARRKSITDSGILSSNFSSEIATITYRSGPEWDLRFGRKLRPPPSTEPSFRPRTPALCPDFLIETYLDHQGEQFCLKYDANSLIYISKAMDLFDMTSSSLESLNLEPPSPRTSPSPLPPSLARSNPYPDHYRMPVSYSKSHPPPANAPPHLPDLAEGLKPLSNTPTLILGVQSDILFPVEQQREVADALRMAGNERVSYYELGGVWGHDTFLWVFLSCAMVDSQLIDLQVGCKQCWRSDSWFPIMITV